MELEFPRGVVDSVKLKHLKKYLKLNWNLQTDEGSLNKILPWGCMDML